MTFVERTMRLAEQFSHYWQSTIINFYLESISVHCCFDEAIS